MRSWVSDGIEVTLATPLLYKMKPRDFDGGIGGLAHVVYREGGHRGPGEGLHFNPGSAAGGALAEDTEGGIVLGFNFDITLVKGQRMTEWNQGGGLLGGHDASKNGGVQD